MYKKIYYRNWEYFHLSKCKENNCLKNKIKTNNKKKQLPCYFMYITIRKI